MLKVIRPVLIYKNTERGVLMQYIQVNYQFVVVMVLYVLFLVGFGIYQGRKVKSGDDFAIAGRSLPGWVAALSERATAESSWCLLGLPGVVYASGLSGTWASIGSFIGIVISWLFIARPLRNDAARYNAVTFTDYLGKRFGPMGSYITVFSSWAIVFFFFFYVGAQFIGGAKTFYTVFNLPINLGMLIVFLIVIPYTIYGGFGSVVYTDCVQAIVMIGALILAPFFGIWYIASDPSVWSHSIIDAFSRADASFGSWTGGLTGFAAFTVIVGEGSWMFGFLGGLPQLATRFMAIKDDREARVGRNIGILWSLGAYIGAPLIGLLGIAIFGPTGLEDPEMVTPAVFLKVFHPAVAALFLTGAIAAMLSTADSLLVLSSTELAENIIIPKLSKTRKIDGKAVLKISRLATAGVAVGAIIAAYFVPTKLINTVVGYAWAGIGSTFSVVILGALFSKRFNSKAAFATMVTGVFFTVFWNIMGYEKSIISARAMTFFVSCTVAFIVTLITAPDPQPAPAEK